MDGENEHNARIMELPRLQGTILGPPDLSTELTQGLHPAYGSPSCQVDRMADCLVRSRRPCRVRAKELSIDATGCHVSRGRNSETTYERRTLVPTSPGGR